MSFRFTKVRYYFFGSRKEGNSYGYTSYAESSSQAAQTNKCQKSADAGEPTNSSSSAVNACVLRTFVFPFCWPETLAENQKHFEQFNDAKHAQLHWHEKVILFIAKRIDFIITAVNRRIWGLMQPKNNLRIKRLSFKEKELFWKFSYVKLGMQLLKVEFDRCLKEENEKAATSATRKTNKVRKLRDADTTNSDSDKLLPLKNLLNREAEHLMTAIRDVLYARIKSRREISHVLQLLERYMYEDN